MPLPFELEENEKGQLVLKRPGEDDVADVRLRRSFPWTKPDALISVRNSDGKEVLLIDDLSALPAELRERVVRFLGETSFIPMIRSVETINMDFGYQVWTVQTDRGPASFRVQEREDVRFLPDGRFSVKDVEGNVYVLPRLETMDAHSQKALATLI